MYYIFNLSSVLCLLLCPIISKNSLEAQTSSFTQNDFHEHEWITDYFASFSEENFSVEEILDFLFFIKESLIAKGQTVPNLSEVCLSIKNYLKDTNTLFNDPDFDLVYDLIQKKENKQPLSYFKPNYPSKNREISLVKHKKKKPSSAKENKEISGEIILGLCKILAGGLCCIIPHPAAQVTGTTLIALGLADIGIEGKELNEKNLKYQEEHGPPPPPPRFPPDFFDKKDK